MIPFTDAAIFAGSGLEPEARALIARMTVKPSALRARAISKFIKSAKKAGFWTKLRCLHFFTAHDKQAATLDWTGITGDATIPDASFTANYGLKSSSGTVAPATTQFYQGNMPGASVDNVHIAVFARRPSQLNGTSIVASSQNYAQVNRVILWLFSHQMGNGDQQSRTRFDFQNGSLSPTASPNSPDDVFAAGIVGGGAPSKAIRAYQNGAYADSSTRTDTLPQRPWLVGAFYDNQDGITSASVAPIRMFSGGYALTPAELAAYESATRTFITDIGAVN